MATQTSLITRLNTELRDIGDKTFTAAEKLEALHRACENEWVMDSQEVQIPITGSRTYNMDTHIKGVYEVQLDYDGDGWPETDVEREGYDFFNNKLVILPKYMNLPTSGILFVTVSWKYRYDDTLIPDNLQAYILNLAIIECVGILKNGYTNRFLKNDVTMADLINRSNDAQTEAQAQRRALRNIRPVRA